MGSTQPINFLIPMPFQPASCSCWCLPLAITWFAVAFDHEPCCPELLPLSRPPSEKFVSLIRPASLPVGQISDDLEALVLFMSQLLAACTSGSTQLLRFICCCCSKRRGFNRSLVLQSLRHKLLSFFSCLSSLRRVAYALFNVGSGSIASRLDLTVLNYSVSNSIENRCTCSPLTYLLRLNSLAQSQFGRTR